MSKILVTLDRFENDKAVLILPDGQNLVVHLKDLAPNVKAGDVLAINFSGSIRQTVQKEKMAKKLLKRVLKRKSS
jgi:hypothetical protein